MIQWKLYCRSRKQKRKTQPIIRSRIEHCDWFTLPLLLATPTMQFSLDRKQRSHKRMQCSASDSVGSIFTRSHRSTLLITTPTTTPSLVKTSLKRVFLWSQLYENVFHSQVHSQTHFRMKGFARELILEQKRKVIQRGFVFGSTTIWNWLSFLVFFYGLGFTTLYRLFPAFQPTLNGAESRSGWTKKTQQMYENVHPTKRQYRSLNFILFSLPLYVHQWSGFLYPSAVFLPVHFASRRKETVSVLFF